MAGTKLIVQRRNYAETFPPFYSKFDRYLTKFGNSLILFLLKKGSAVKYGKVLVLVLVLIIVIFVLGPIHMSA